MQYTGCRPAEARLAKWSEINQSGDVWRFEPEKHKTSHRGKSRVIFIGPKLQKILNGLRELTRSDYVFDPQVAFDEFVRKNYREGAKARKVGEFYTADSLRGAIRTACKKHDIPHWSPGQIRKTVATEARRLADLETAQQILGHASKTTTEKHYAAEDLSRAEAIALVIG